jgi:hypothetical protein
MSAKKKSPDGASSAKPETTSAIPAVPPAPATPPVKPESKAIAVTKPFKEEGALWLPETILTATSLKLAHKMPLDFCRELLGKFLVCESAVLFWWGDLIAQALDWGYKYDDLIRDMKLPWAKGTVKNIVSTCQNVPPSRRRDDVSFGHHVEVQGCDAAEQTRLLKEAAITRWTRAQLRRKVNGTPDPEPTTEPLKPSEVPPEVKRLALDDLSQARKWVDGILESLPDLKAADRTTLFEPGSELVRGCC